MNAVILSACLLGGNADLDARVALALAMASPPKVASVCPCGSGCACGPACDCPDVPKLPPIRRTVLASPVAYPQHMAPMPAFRPYQPAPMYFGGFGGGSMPFGGCVGGA